MPKQHILVVDDSELTLEIVRGGLEQLGYQVTTLDNPIEMSAVIRQNKPDVIVLDVKMPLLSGDKVIEILKKYRFSGEIPVILFSDLGEDELERMAQSTEAAGYIKKSGDLAPLADEIERLLGSGASARDE